ncbi:MULTISPECIES: hypothetical protein [Paenibacillus]|jgi:hypothetical protein|uniref:Uncharacterized protein n=1 Tax=Paenibacillus peoriae TaxID=59893 RepID=A0ABU1QDI4_9BACL|nr:MULTISPECIES: hypothetical protein [Paenibacillus]MCP3744371.1 hypothetical protein [Paenibacillus sp. A3M_27_13]MDR6777618.1 hypothetical protein [Paenibacillus peoriae]SFR01493.1 hypothetical protein SAMN04488603_101998 [Paenibacillus sp. cl130]VUG06448.1 hypothetical protein PPOLYM_02849 [Paenibacillus polymyxa]
MTDWKRKLSSRKFWALLAALLTSLLTAFGANNDTVIQVTRRYRCIRRSDCLHSGGGLCRWQVD